MKRSVVVKNMKVRAHTALVPLGAPAYERVLSALRSPFLFSWLWGCI